MDSSVNAYNDANTRSGLNLFQSTLNPNPCSSGLVVSVAARPSGSTTRTSNPDRVTAACRNSLAGSPRSTGVDSRASDSSGQSLARASRASVGSRYHGPSCRRQGKSRRSHPSQRNPGLFSTRQPERRQRLAPGCRRWSLRRHQPLCERMARASNQLLAVRIYGTTHLPLTNHLRAPSSRRQMRCPIVREVGPPKSVHLR